MLESVERRVPRARHGYRAAERGGAARQRPGAAARTSWRTRAARSTSTASMAATSGCASRSSGVGETEMDIWPPLAVRAARPSPRRRRPAPLVPPAAGRDRPECAAALRVQAGGGGLGDARWLARWQVKLEARKGRHPAPAGRSRAERSGDRRLVRRLVRLPVPALLSLGRRGAGGEASLGCYASKANYPIPGFGSGVGRPRAGGADLARTGGPAR